MGLFGRKKKTPTPEEFRENRTFDYSTPESRVLTAEWLLTDAKNNRAVVESEWVRYNDYYNFIRGATDEVRESIRESGINWDPAVTPDPWIMVESQIDPKVPEPEFKGRDDDMDSVKAKEREFAVKYILDANRLEDKNTSNEEIQATISAQIKDLNKKLVAYKQIRVIEFRSTEFEKTTSRKIKRHLVK